MTVLRATTLVLLLIVQQACSQSCTSQLDLVFVLDASKSVGSQNFPLMLNFLDAIVQSQASSINSGDTRVGLLRYSSPGDTIRVFDLNTYNNAADVSSAILATSYPASYTYTGNAIDMMLTDSLQASAGDRSNVSDVAIVVTDGASSDDVVAPSSRATARGVEMYAVGISGAKVSELNAIATDPDSSHVLFVNNFSDLSGFTSTFTTTVCSNSGSGATTNNNGDAFASARTRPEVIGGVIGGALALIGALVGGAVCCAKGLCGKRRSNDQQEEEEPNADVRRGATSPVSVNALEATLPKAPQQSGYQY